MRTIPDRPVTIEFPDGSRHTIESVSRTAYCLRVSKGTINNHLKDGRWFKCKPIFSNTETVAKIYPA